MIRSRYIWLLICITAAQFSAACRAASGNHAGAHALADVHSACQHSTWRANMRLDVAMPGWSGAVTAVALADPRPGRLAVESTMNMGSVTMENRIVGGAMFARNGSTKWFKTDLTTIPADQRRSPCDEFAVLGSPKMTGVEDMGSDWTGAAHHYRFHADAYTLLAAAMLYSPQPLAALHHDDPQIVADLFVDSSGRPVRYTTGTAKFTDATGARNSLALTEIFTDFGTAVDVIAPDPSQVTDQLPSDLITMNPPKPTA